MTHKPLLSSQKRELLAQLLKDQGLGAPQPGLQPRPGDRTTAPLSFAQQRLWFLNQLEPTSSVYNLLLPFRLEGPLDAAALEAAFNAVIERHEILRTTFQLSGEQPIQVIAPQLKVAFAEQDLRGLTPAAQEVEVKRLARQAEQQPFDLAHGPLIRLHLLRLAEAAHALFIELHHIIFDGWSFDLLFQDIARAYAAYRTGETPITPALPIQYADFAYWQRDSFQGAAFQKQIVYWKEKLGGKLPVLQLPTDHPRPAVQTIRGGYRPLVFSVELQSALQALSQQAGVTLFTTYLAAFKVLLARYTGQADIIVGIPIAGRGRAEVRELIGVFLNMLVLRTDLSGDPTFRDLLARVRITLAGAHANQDVPFEQLVEILQPERDLSRNPLYQVTLVMIQPGINLTLPDLHITWLTYEPDYAKLDLSLDFGETPTGLVGGLKYNADLFEAETIERLSEHFEQLLKGIAANPEQPLSALPLLTTAERRQIVVDWNATHRPYPVEFVHTSFEAQAAQIPEAVALVYEEQYLTYGELNRRADQLASHLRKLGVGPEARVGLYLERSLEMIVGLLGIFKAGAAYVPLDTSFPPERLAFMLEDSQAPVLLTQSKQLAAGGWQLAATNSHPPSVICLDTDWPTIAQSPIPLRSALGTIVSNQQSPICPNNLAYVIYTSGSTGRPKGVMVEHRQLSNYLNAILEKLAPGPHAHYASISTLAADMGHTMIYSALCRGGCLHIIAEQRITDPDALADYFQRHPMDCLKFVPSHLATLLSSTAFAENLKVSRLIIGGEATSWSLIEQIQSNLAEDCILLNHYGPTETTVGVLTYPLGQSPVERRATTTPIGRPLANTQAYLLDEHLQPVPVGVLGEVYLGGENVARGYLNRPELTAERFIPNPFVGMQEQAQGARPKAQRLTTLSLESLSLEPFAPRLYKTGDIARYLPDGNIEFLGRRDRQVKIRGYRVELGEIEALLSRHPAIREAVVIAYQAGSHPQASAQDHSEMRLAAYIVADPLSKPTPADLRAFMKDKAPDHLIPSTFTFLEALPLMPNRKVDRQALPLPEISRATAAAEYVAPRTATERTLAQIYSHLLKIETVGVHDNFFELGGHSLLATRVVVRIREAFSFELPLRALFEHPTIAELAAQVDQRQQTPRIETDKLARLLTRVQSLSDDEVEALLQEEE